MSWCKVSCRVRLVVKIDVIFEQNWMIIHLLNALKHVAKAR